MTTGLGPAVKREMQPGQLSETQRKSSNDHTCQTPLLASWCTSCSRLPPVWEATKRAATASPSAERRIGGSAISDGYDWIAAACSMHSSGSSWVFQSPSTSWTHKRPLGVRQDGIPQDVYSLQRALTAYVVDIPRRYLRRIACVDGSRTSPCWL